MVFAAYLLENAIKIVPRWGICKLYLSPTVGHLAAFAAFPKQNDRCGGGGGGGVFVTPGPLLLFNRPQCVHQIAYLADKFYLILFYK